MYSDVLVHVLELHSRDVLYYILVYLGVYMHDSSACVCVCVHHRSALVLLLPHHMQMGRYQADKVIIKLLRQYFAR